MLINLNTVLDRYELWKKELPMIEVFAKMMKTLEFSNFSHSMR